MNTDFLIIGGGIAGVSAAAELSSLGSVALCESEDNLAHHASGRSAALYEPYYGPPAIVDAVARLGRRSGAVLHAARCADGRVGRRGRGFPARIRKDAPDRDHPDEAAALFPALDPAKVVRAGTSDHARDIDTDALIQFHARRARANGAQFYLRSPVTGIERTTRLGGRSRRPRSI